MTGTGESLADTHIHMNRHMEAGGATLGFTVLWYYPVLLPDRGPAARREGEGGKDTPLLGWRETRERKPNPAPLFFFFFPTPLQTCHTQTNTLARDHEVMYFNVSVQFHSCPLDLSFFRGHSTLPRIIHSQNHSSEAWCWLHNSSSTWNTCTFILEPASRPCCFASRATNTNSACDT